MTDSFYGRMSYKGNTNKKIDESNKNRYSVYNRRVMNKSVVEKPSGIIYQHEEYGTGNTSSNNYTDKARNTEYSIDDTHSHIKSKMMKLNENMRNSASINTRSLKSTEYNKMTKDAIKSYRRKVDNHDE